MNNHSYILDKLLHSKSERDNLGLEGVIWGGKEIPWWKGNQLYCETDLLFFTGAIYVFQYHVVEYKRTNNERGHAIDQLARSEEFVREFFNADCYKWLVTGPYRNLEVEHIGKHPRKRR